MHVSPSLVGARGRHCNARGLLAEGVALQLGQQLPLGGRGPLPHWLLEPVAGSQARVPGLMHAWLGLVIKAALRGTYWACSSCKHCYISTAAVNIARMLIMRVIS
jgi:hypothetical protein